MTDDAADLRRLARTLAEEAGALAASMRVELASGADDDLGADTKSSGSDLVTAADRAAEELLRRRILEARPDDGIVGEEGDDHPSTSGRWWIVDPIDGTTNFVYGLPTWTVSVAVRDGLDGPMLAGAVHAPALGRTYSAHRGGGADRNGEPIRVATTSTLDVALCATGFAYRPERRSQQGRVAQALLPEVRDLRRLGSAALDLCLTAEGAVDAYYEHGLNPWDLAAGWVIAAEAGATLGDLRGGPPSASMTVAANPALFPLLVERLAELDADGPADHSA